ncbi:MAG: polysaccharide deacetylase family protein [Desulfomonile tiedjei]|uniref:Polysaccharide deacetylase family protein n=1 Tax=Desulfomonile tiedjei TaxID=2358 RepID=A0A9D6V5I4_9BACT|nr:polysaccharide deacetylase family protein [Desulfomonile tiedjei]
MRSRSIDAPSAAEASQTGTCTRRRFISVGAGIVISTSSVPSLVEELASLLNTDSDHVNPQRGEILPPEIHRPEKEPQDQWQTPQPLFLTFDDGPLLCTGQILEHLARKKHKATFFVIGRNLLNPKLRELAITALKEGHDIGNHSYDHPNFANISARRAEKEIVTTHDLIQGVVREAGVNPRRQDLFFRFPYGMAGSSHNQGHCQDVLAELNYRIAWWNLDTNDWRMELAWFPRSSSRVIRSLNRARPGDVVLLHDRMKTAEHLPRMLEVIESQKLVSFPLSTYEPLDESSVLARGSF